MRAVLTLTFAFLVVVITSGAAQDQTARPLSAPIRFVEREISIPAAQAFPGGHGAMTRVPVAATPFPLRRDGMAFDVLSNTAQTAADSFPENEWYLSILVKGRLHPDGAGTGQLPSEDS
jgi:hypothetical protein